MQLASLAEWLRVADSTLVDSTALVHCSALVEQERPAQECGLSHNHPPLDRLDFTRQTIFY